MSEDATVKPGNRRRRTTRAGRRRAAGRPGSDAPGEGHEGNEGNEGAEERWSVSPAVGEQLDTDPDTLPGEAVEEIHEGQDDDEREDEEGGRESGDDAPPDRVGPREATGAGGEEDRRKTEEILIHPLPLAQFDGEEEKTKPRVRVNELFPDSYASEQDDESKEPVQIWSRPSSRSEAPGRSAQSDAAVAVLRSVVIAPAKVAFESPAAAPAGRAEPPERSASPPPRISKSGAGASPPPPPPAQAPPARMPASPSPVAQADPAPAAFVPEPPNAEQSVASAGSTFEALGDELADGSGRLSDPELPIVMEVADLDAERSSRTPPPPPPDARAKPAAQKRPPPPPAPPPAKVEDERSRRKQVRQWWERFFSEDYLMSVIAPSQAQIGKQVDFIEQSLGVSKGGTILDVGCGLGLHAVELTRRGYLVVGLDLSLAMITRAAELAQEQQLKLNVVHADIREMEFDGAFDGVICMGTTFGFFDDDANRDVLARLYQALRPGGRALLDMVNRDYVIGSQPNLVWYEGDECVCMEESDFNYFNSRLTVKRTIMREDGRQSHSEYSLRLYSLHELGQMMQQVGFRVIEVSGQEALRGAFFGAHSPRVVMLAERRAPARPSAVSSFDRTTVEGRVSAAFPPERGSAEIPKSPRSE